MTDRPENCIVSSADSGDVPVIIEQETVGENGGDESRDGSGGRKVEVESGEASVGDAQGLLVLLFS